jgi:hypothetical protein
MLPAAAAVALSPIPIAAVVLVLGTPRALASGSAFASGWVLGLAAIMTIALALTDGSDDHDSARGLAVDVALIVVGSAFLLLAARKWRTRPRDGAAPPTPRWMKTLAAVTPARALLLGAATSGANPKNMALTAAGAASISQAGVEGGQAALAGLAFVLIGSATVVGLVLAHAIAPERSAGALARIQRFMLANSAVIMMVILVLLGAKILGDGLEGLGAR